MGVLYALTKKLLNKYTHGGDSAKKIEQYVTISTDEINEENYDDFRAIFNANLLKTENPTYYKEIATDINTFSVERNKEKVFEMKDSNISFKTPIDSDILNAFVTTMSQMRSVNKDSIIVVETCPGGMKEAELLLEALKDCGTVKFSEAALEQIKGKNPNQEILDFVDKLPKEEEKKKKLKG